MPKYPELLEPSTKTMRSSHFSLVQQSYNHPIVSHMKMFIELSWKDGDIKRNSE